MASSSSAAPAVAFEGLTQRFERREVLHGVDLVVEPGERVAVLGPSGAGKTTLLRLAAGSLWPSAGRVRTLGEDTSRLAGRRLRALRRRVGVLHQGDSLVDGLRVVHNVAIGRLGHWSLARALWSLARPQELERTRAALAEVELADRLWDLPGTLSGGQRQRVAIARLLAQEPDLILADEPAAALDPRMGRDVIERLDAAAARRGAALVVSLHAVELLDAGFERVLALRAGRVVWDGPAAAVDRAFLRDLYDAPAVGPARGA